MVYRSNIDHVVLSFKLSPSLRQAIDIIATNRGGVLSNLIREAVIDFLNNPYTNIPDRIGEDYNNKVTTVKVSIDLYTRMEKFRLENGLTMSQLIRKALIKYMLQHRGSI